MERDDRLSYLEYKYSPDQFLTNLYFKESSYNLPERFYHVICLLGQKAYDFFYLDNIQRPYQYKILVYSKAELPKVFEGTIDSLGDLHNTTKGLTVGFLDYVLSLLKGLQPNKALRQCYHFLNSVQEAMIFENSNSENIFKEFLFDFSSLIEHKIIYYERLIKLNNYDKFIRLKQPLQNDSVILWRLSEDELCEIAEFYLTIISPSKGQLNKDLMKSILIDIFNGNSEIDFLVLTGRKYQLADTFLQLYKNDKIRSRTRADFVNWVNNKFRLIEGDQYSYIGKALDDLLKKGKGQPPREKRLNLPGFLDYYLYNKDKKEFIPQKR